MAMWILQALLWVPLPIIPVMMAISFSHTQDTLDSAPSLGIGVEKFLHVWVSDQCDNESEDIVLITL